LGDRWHRFGSVVHGHDWDMRGFTYAGFLNQRQRDSTKWLLATPLAQSRFGARANRRAKKGKNSAACEPANFVLASTRPPQYDRIALIRKGIKERSLNR
jgi:hypothetical protein